MMQNNGNGTGRPGGTHRSTPPSAPNQVPPQDTPAYPRRRPGMTNASGEQVQRILQQQVQRTPARTAQKQTPQPQNAQMPQSVQQPARQPVRRAPLSGAQQPEQMKKKGTISVKPRFFIFCAVALALVIGIFAGLGAIISALLAGEAVISYGRIEDVTKVQALIIRNETSVRAEGYGSLEYLVPEMSYVTENTPVVEVYATGYSGEKIKELDKLMVDIAQQQKKALGDIMNVTLNDYDSSIQTQVNTIVAAMRDEPERLHESFTQLGALMKARQDYIEKTTEAKEDPSLAQHYAAKAQLMTQIDAWKSQYRAPGEGIVSYSFDGLEPYLNMDTLQALDAAAVKELLRDNNPEVPDELRAQQNLYRLVQPNEWYVAFTTKPSTWKIGIGETCAIYFESFEDITYNAEVLSLNSTGDDLMVLLKMSEDVSPLINARKLNAVIGGRVEGMMVPLSSLKTQGGLQGVYRADTGEFVEVRVVGQDSKHALIMPIENGALASGMKIRK